jgi:response regulator NasT
MRILLVDDDPARRTLIETSLRELGHDIVGLLAGDADMAAAVKRHQPDVILVDVEAPTRDTLESLGQVHRNQPRPIVLFASSSDPATIQRAVRAGVTSYIVDGLEPTRLRPILDVAIAHFQETQSLRRELEDARNKLADRRDVEKAKGILMKRRGLDEAAAYDMLRRMAMDRSLRIGEAARALLAAADLL